MKITKKDISRILIVIMTNYQFAYNGESNEAMGLVTETWYDCFKPYDKTTIEEAAKQALLTCKSPPTIADVMDGIILFEQASGQTPERMWADFYNVVKEGAIMFCQVEKGLEDEDSLLEEWEKLPAVLKEFCGMDYQQFLVYLDEGINAFDKSRFFKSYPQMIRRLNIRRNYPGMVGLPARQEKKINGNGATEWLTELED